MEFKNEDFLKRDNINYIDIIKIDDNIIITNIDDYFKSNIYKNLCKYSKLSKIKINNRIYIPELFIDSYASWYSSIYYLNKLKLNKIEQTNKIEQNKIQNTLDDILQSVIHIKTDIATIATIATPTQNLSQSIKPSNIIQDIDKKFTNIYTNSQNIPYNLQIQDNKLKSEINNKTKHLISKNELYTQYNNIKNNCRDIFEFPLKKTDE